MEETNMEGVYTLTQDGSCRNIGQCKVNVQRMSCTDFMSPVVNTKTSMNCRIKEAL